MTCNSAGSYNGILFDADHSHVTLKPLERYGTASVPSSKSIAHRLLICAALSQNETKLILNGCSEDIDATAGCLKSMGALIEKTVDGGRTILSVRPIRKSADAGKVSLDVKESGSTYRFLLPVACALGIDVGFILRGRLPERPVKPLLDALTGAGASISVSDNVVSVSGRIKPGTYRIPGNISSQFISGLLFALPLLDGDSNIVIGGNVESRHYIEMTESVLHESGIVIRRLPDGYFVPGGQQYHMSGLKNVETDWSGAAFMLCTGVLSRKGVTVKNLNMNSTQGDKKIVDLLRAFGAGVEIDIDGRVKVYRKELKGMEIDASEIPDLVPVLSVVAAFAEGETRITNAGRLRLKESDRIESTLEMINSLGGSAAATNDGLVIYGRKELSGGSVRSCEDHRIAMSAAVASLGTTGDVTIDSPGCVSKSFPSFWDVFGRELSADNIRR